MMYIGYWCEEHFNSLILGSPDISHNKMISLMEILCVIPILDIVVFPPLLFRILFLDQFVVEKVTATKDPCNLQLHLNCYYFNFDPMHS